MIAKAEAGGEKQAELYVDVTIATPTSPAIISPSGDWDKASNDIKSVVSYAEKARATVGAFRRAHQTTEMKMHKLQRRVEEVARATDVDDRPPVTAAAEHVEELRSELLDLLFRKDEWDFLHFWLALALPLLLSFESLREWPSSRSDD